MRTTPTELEQRWFAAADAGDLDGLRAALADGVDPDARDPEQATAILRAARAQAYEAVAFLVERGVDMDAQDETCVNPFLHGCLTGDAVLVRQMVEAGADLTRLTRMGGNGLTPAAEKGHLDVVRYLLEHTTINVNHTNNLGWTALIETIILGDGGPDRQWIVALLLEHGAKPGMTDPWGVPPVQLAREKGHGEIAALLDRAAG